MMKSAAAFVFSSFFAVTSIGAAFHYHSRHIPSEHLDLTKHWAKVTRDGGLCDCLEPEKIAQLKAAGVDTIELRLVWWALEKSRGTYDFSRLDRDVAKVEKAGLTPGLMAWLNHPPSWYKGTTFECAVHQKRGSTLSAWDPSAVEIADKIYAAAAARYGKRIGYVYVTGSGDYGEPTLPHGVDHYHFSSPHRHDGLGWTGDAFARAAWAKISPVSIENVLAGKADRATALAYADFIAERTARYAADMYRVIRKNFPWARYGHPIGHTAEYFYGQNRARVVKYLAEVSPDITCRWTGLAYYGSFHRSNVIARRVSSACHFYGCAFGEEASTPESISGKNAANAIYEMIANDTTMIHNDYGNIVRSGKENIERAKNLPHEPFVCDVAVLWPDIPEKIASVPFVGRGERPSPHAIMNAFLDAAGEFRKRTDYEICDLGMIADGFLEKKNIRKLVVFHRLEPEEEAALAPFRKSGGSVTDGSEFPPPPEPLVFKTRHLTFTSSFNPATGEIKIEKHGDAAETLPKADAKITVVGTPIGPIKRMNAVGGAPGRKGTVDFEAWKALEIPYARTHDLNNHAEYGAPWALDVTRIFVDFDADENDPANYRFAETDAIVKRIQDAGSKVFYRLGCPFENQLRKKTHESGTPKDMEKYARICGNIIAHYNRGWANGFRYGIEYWEFWNEPDLSAFWTGTRDEFQRLWITVAKHVKGRFPEIKFGGPAVSGDMGWVDRMIGEFARQKVPLDFVSWHCYQPSPVFKTRFERYVKRARDVLDKHGYVNAESILNEWNYCLSMSYVGRQYSAEVHCGREAAKGAAFIGCVMHICQNGPLDMLMFYSGLRARVWNSMFDMRTNEPLPGYYAFYAWKKLARLGTQIKVDVEAGDHECLTAVAAVGKDSRKGLFISKFTENSDTVLPSTVEIVLPGTEGAREVVCHVTDDTKLYTECVLRRAPDGAFRLKLKPNAMAYIEY